MGTYTTPAVDYDAAQKAFTHIYDENVWGKGSGASAPEITQPYMHLLTRFIRENEIKSVVDVGCGDWQFSRALDWSKTKYIGYDVVASVIESNKNEFGSENVEFHKLSSMHELRSADLVVCKDVLQHLPTIEVAAYLRFFLYNYKFALVTNDNAAFVRVDDKFEAVPDHRINCEIEHGGYRMIKPNKAPFFVPSALLLEWDIESPDMRWTKSTYLLVRPF